MLSVSLRSSPMVYKAYKDDSFRRGRSARCAIGLACRDFEAHVDVSKPSTITCSYS